MTRADRTHWAPSTTAWRTAPLPVGWKAIKARVKDRDGHQCTVVENGRRCPATTELEVDHIGDPWDHADDNLRTICTPHHASKTGAGARAVQLARQAALKRPTRPHPGLLG